MRWFIDHAETIRTAEHRADPRRSAAASRSSTAWPIRASTSSGAYGREAARALAAASARCSRLGLPVGAGTDGTRVASYHPWTCLDWLVDRQDRRRNAAHRRSEALLSREEALRLYTQGSAWFSGEAGRRAQLAIGQYADLAVLSDDYLTCPDDAIRRIESVLTVCDGTDRPRAGDFAPLAPPLPPISPSWSPTARYGGYANEAPAKHDHAAVFGADGRLWEMGCGCAV